MKGHQKIIFILGLVTLSLLIIKGYRNYGQINTTYRTIVFEESHSLANILLSVRDSYRLFVSKNPENCKTQKLLPVDIIDTIVEKFEKFDKGKRQIRLTSSTPHAAQKAFLPKEKHALKWLEENEKAPFYFTQNRDKYTYIAPLRVDNACIQCHTKNNFSFNEGKTSWKYEEGSVLGVLSIEGSNPIVKETLLLQYFYEMFFYTLSGIGLFVVVALVIKRTYSKDEDYRKNLEKEVKTQESTLEEQSKQLHFQLHHDSLTLLPNRNQLIVDLAGSKELSLALVNIDDFKHINDLYGQDAGDEVIIAFGEFLKTFSKEHNAKLYKLHADEFALVFKNISTLNLKNAMLDLLEELRQFIVLTDDDYDIGVTATIGAAREDNFLLTHADMALKRAKKNKISYLLYGEAMEIKKEYENNIKWTKRIKRAIKDDQIVPYYQAIFNSQDRSMAHLEVLMRLIDENGDAISPVYFLDISKKSKLYPKLTRTIISKSMQELSSYDVEFSLNISIMDIVNQKTLEFILDQIDSFPNPNRITFEILESEGIENYKEVFDFVSQVKARGCKIAIDDFGSGYSSFAHILNLNVDLLKIDGSLVHNIDTSKNAHITTQAIISFAKALNIKTCAEYVHSKEVYEILCDMKVDFLQGFYLAKPLPFKDIKSQFLLNAKAYL